MQSDYLRDELLAIPGIDESSQYYLRQLAAMLPDITPTTQSDPLQQAEYLLEEGDYDQAFLILSNTPSSKQKVRLLLQCAYELQTLAAQKAALNGFDELTSEEQKTLQTLRWNRDYLAQLRGIKEEETKDNTHNIPYSEAVPTNWQEWLLKLNKEPNWEQALDVARQGATEWDVSSLLNQQGAVKQFIQLQENIFSQAESVLHNALPHLLGFFQKDEYFPRSDFLPIYRSLLELLVLSTEGSDADLSLFNDLLIVLLKLGVNKEKYTEIVGYGWELWKRFDSPKNVDWILDLIDILVLYSCPGKELREQLIFEVAKTLRRFYGRIDEAQWGIFRSLIQDLNIKESFPDLLEKEINLSEENVEEEENIFQKLKGKSVLIYTLTESVALRVKNILEAACKGVTVYFSHDKGGNDRLRQWVRNADIIVMVTASAKHAATLFIQANRPQNLSPILLVNSKGSASILRAIRDYLN